MTDDPFAERVVTPERIGLAAFVVMVSVFAYLGHTLFESVLFGGLVGIVFGAGSLLEIPYFLRRAAIEEGEASAEAMAGDHARRAAWGMALTVGGFVALSARFVAEGEFLRPLLVGAVVAVLVGVPLGRAFPSLSAVEEPRDRGVAVRRPPTDLSPTSGPSPAAVPQRLAVRAPGVAMDIEDVFPEIETIADDSLRTGVATAWTSATGVNGLDVADLPEVPWLPPVQADLGIEADEALLVDHVRDVASCAVGLAESLLSRRDDDRESDGAREIDLDLDTVIAGALIHDVSKLYEYDGTATTEVGDLLGHPYYGVAVVSRANLPVEIAHVVLSHSSRTTVEPATLEAEIVRRADEVAAASLRAGAVDDLRDA